ncbi:MAG TPA: efflux RND transporter periplasmic adaptor subunit [Gemmatimonadaceae bacterium]|nr:efflux RND transporter periplasmic adaptor subunit [Gemmatimonadaceae bacterium]
MNASEQHTGAPRPRSRRASRGRLTAIALAGIVAIGIIAWIALARRSGRAGVGSTTRTSATTAGAAMPGMPGMDMSGTARGGTLTLTASQRRQFGVTFGTAEMRTLTSDTRATGIVTVDETRVTQVAPKFGGFVERLYVNATGQRVGRGQPLLEVYSPELVAAQQELLAAGQLEREIGRSAVPGVPGSTSDLVAAAKRRLQLWDISNAQIAEVLRTGRPRRALTLFSPASGVVLEKRVVQGQAIAAGESLYTIADLSGVWIDVQLRGIDAEAVRPGTAAEIQLAGLPGPWRIGRVSYVYPTIDTTSRALRARVVVANADGALKPGMYATVRLSTPRRSALTVPSAAVLRGGDRDVVFVDVGDGSLLPREVEIGGSAGALTEILGGLEPGQRVVTSAQFLLDSESNLGEVMKSMIAQMPAGDNGAGMRGMPTSPTAPAPR